MSDEKNPKEASNIFHSIMKASVSKTATEKKSAFFDDFIIAVKDKFKIDISSDSRGIVYPKDTPTQTVADIQDFYKSFKP